MHALVAKGTEQLSLPAEAHRVSEQAGFERGTLMDGSPLPVGFQALLDFYNVTLDRGLSHGQVEEQRARFGLNQLAEQAGAKPQGGGQCQGGSSRSLRHLQAKKSLWELVLEQFDDLLVRILLLPPGLKAWRLHGLALDFAGTGIARFARVKLRSAFVSFLLAYFNTDDQKEGVSAYIEPLVILMILVLNVARLQIGTMLLAFAIDPALQALAQLACGEACVGVWQESNAEQASLAMQIVRVFSGPVT